MAEGGSPLPGNLDFHRIQPQDAAVVGVVVLADFAVVELEAATFAVGVDLFAAVVVVDTRVVVAVAVDYVFGNCAGAVEADFDAAFA